MKVQIVVCQMPKEEPNILVFAEQLTEQQVVESIANDLPWLSEEPKTLAELNECVEQIEFTLSVQEVIT